MRDDIPNITTEHAMKMYNWWRSEYYLTRKAYNAWQACVYARYAGINPDPVLVLVAELERHSDLR